VAHWQQEKILGQLEQKLVGLCASPNPESLGVDAAMLGCSLEHEEFEQLQFHCKPLQEFSTTISQAVNSQAQKALKR